MKKLLNGDYPLWQMFWIWFLIIPAIIRGVLFVTGVVTIANDDNSAGHDMLVIGALGLFMLAYYVVVFVGTWRSATRYSKENTGIFGGSKGIDWGLIAKFAMVVLFIVSGMSVL